MVAQLEAIIFLRTLLLMNGRSLTAKAVMFTGVANQER